MLKSNAKEKRIMRKRSKLWLALLAVVMVLGQCLTVSEASNPYIQIEAFGFWGLWQ